MIKLKSKLWRFLVVIIIGLLFLLSFFISKPLYFDKNPSPQIVLWAWEKPEDLSFIESENVGVAFYAGTITFDRSKTSLKRRLQPLTMNPSTPVIPVIRIANKEDPEQINDNQLEKAVEMIVRVCTQDTVSSCQIDFDVRDSEIKFYKKLISETRNNLPKSVPLSITTLVSWCHSGSWLKDLPVDEVVPMFFSLGLNEYNIRHGFVGESFMEASSCQDSIGISVGEPLPSSKYLKNRKIYIFNPEPWTYKDFSNIMTKIGEAIKQ